MIGNICIAKNGAIEHHLAENEIEVKIGDTKVNVNFADGFIEYISNDIKHRYIAKNSSLSQYMDIKRKHEKIIFIYQQKAKVYLLILERH